ncbi:MAG TPA: TonB-dependent receptor [Steroidobacteraceae bacterium]|nr:TonB-dependent receptor [Steroidobacteraceae bacterium]
MKILATVAAALLALGTIAADADTMPADQLSFLIESKTLDEALDEWAKQTGFQIFVTDWGLAKQLPAPRLLGKFSARAALEKLLEGTPLTWVLLDERTVLVREKARSAPPKDTVGTTDRPPPSPLALGLDGRARDPPEEVIVTAQRREERLQDVPMAISVLRGKDLDRFTGQGISEALALVPGIKITQEGLYAGGNMQLSIRGVSASGPTFNGSSPVAYYIDSVPFGLVKTAIAPDANAYDLERVEVLRGPQGTLYGASALNGVVRILTHDADLEQFEFKTRASLAQTEGGAESYRDDLAVNVPLIQGKLGARAVLGYSYGGGWIDSVNKKDANDAEVINARLKIAARPTEDFYAGLTGWISRTDFGAPSLSTDEDTFPGHIRQPMSTDYDVLGLKLGYDFAAFSLTSMTSYIDYHSPSKVDLSGIGIEDTLDTTLDSKVLAQEVNLNSTGEGSWRWSVGGFYRDAKDRLVQASEVVLPGQPVDFTDKSESFAFFGELTRVFADGKFELTGGARYFKDHVQQIENSPQSPVPGTPLLPPTRTTFDAVTPRVVLNWHPGENSTVYGSYSEGFRSGFGQNANIIRAAPSFKPVAEDKLRNYELGLKGTVLGGNLMYEAAVYFIDWADVQQTVLVAIPAGSANFFSAVVNGQSASGPGIDLALTARPVEQLECGISFSWNDLGLDKEVASGGVVVFDNGDRLNYSAEYTVAASVAYVFALNSSGLEARFSASGNYSSAQTIRSLRGSALSVFDGDDTLVGRTSLAISTQRWSTSLFVENVNNERGTPVVGAPDFFFSSRLRPRTTGIQFAYHF